MEDNDGTTAKSSEMEGYNGTSTRNNVGSGVNNDGQIKREAGQVSTGTDHSEGHDTRSSVGKTDDVKSEQSIWQKESMAKPSNKERRDDSSGEQNGDEGQTHSNQDIVQGTGARMIGDDTIKGNAYGGPDSGNEDSEVGGTTADAPSQNFQTHNGDKEGSLKEDLSDKVTNLTSGREISNDISTRLVDCLYRNNPRVVFGVKFVIVIGIILFIVKTQIDITRLEVRLKELESCKTDDRKCPYSDKNYEKEGCGKYELPKAEIEQLFQPMMNASEAKIDQNIKLFATNFTESLLKYETDLSRIVVKYTSFENTTTDQIRSLKEQQTELNKTVHENKKMIDGLSEKLQVVQEEADGTAKLQVDIKRDMEIVKPNVFNREALITAIFLMLGLLLILAFVVFGMYRKHTEEAKVTSNMNSNEILKRVQHSLPLDNAVCIISFDEGRRDAHRQLLDSVSLFNCRVACHVIRRHADIPELPKCKVYLMCTEFSERHVIIEEPGLGLGDLHRTTYDAVHKMGGKLIILYTKDPGSRNLMDGKRYNEKVYCVTHQPELVALDSDNRFYSVYDTLSTFQKKELRQKITQCLS